MVSRFVRKVRTASGAVAVQVVTRQGRQVLGIEHLGSAHTDDDLALLVAAAKARLLPAQDVLDLGATPAVPARMEDVADWTLPADLPSPATRRARRGGDGAGRVVATSSLLLWQVLTAAYARVGFDALDDEAFRAMVPARNGEPTSKADTLRVLAELGAPCPSLSTLFRFLKRCQDNDYRDKVARACTAFSAAAGGFSALIMYDCTRLHFEAEDEDALRTVGMSKEHRVDPQVQVGLLVDPSGFPLEVHLFEGNTAETTTLLPVLRTFQQRHGITGMVVVADAGMLSAANLNAIEDAGVLLHRRVPDHQGPYDLAEHFARHGDYVIDGQILESTRAMGTGKSKRQGCRRFQAPSGHLWTGTIWPLTCGDPFGEVREHPRSSGWLSR